MKKMLFAMCAVGLFTVCSSSTAQAQRGIRAGGCVLPNYYAPRVVYRPNYYYSPRVYSRRYAPYRYRNAYYPRYRSYRYGNPYWYGRRGGINIQGRRFGLSIGF